MAHLAPGAVVLRRDGESEEEFSHRVSELRAGMAEEAKAADDAAHADDPMTKARRAFEKEPPRAEPAVQYTAADCDEARNPAADELDIAAGAAPERASCFIALDRAEHALAQIRQIRFGSDAEAIAAVGSAITYALLDVAAAIRES